VLQGAGDGENDSRRLAPNHGDESPNISERSAAISELVAAYATAPGSPAGEALAEVLGPTVRRLAREAAHGGTRGDRDEFVAESLTFVIAPRKKSPPRICLYRPETGPLEPWLRELLKNGWRDKCRAAARRLYLYSETFDAPAPPVLYWPSEPEELIRVFLPADLERIGRWKAAQRVELLCLAGLWRKVTKMIWESFLVDYENSRGLELGRPMPPPSFLRHDDPQSRMQVLARALCLPRANLLSQHWKRWQHLLGELEFIRGLLPNLKSTKTKSDDQTGSRPGDSL
jgi:DNA-directed RNA polymerase specialized sigma24 family protein